MPEKPIIFSGPMVNAILNGEKTQTRRVIKGDPFWFDGELVRCVDDENFLPVKYPIKPGDLLWVRETFDAHEICSKTHVVYRANCGSDGDGEKWKPSIFMPRWASRITLRVTGVRAEQLQSITYDDVESEGVGTIEGITPDYWVKPWADLWDSINAKRGYSWDSNPWVWVYTFEQVDIHTPSVIQ